MCTCRLGCSEGPRGIEGATAGTPLSCAPVAHECCEPSGAGSPAPRHRLSQTGRFGLKRGDLDPLQLRERELGVLHKAFQPYSPAKLSAWKWSGIHLLLLKSSFGLWETKCLTSNTSSKAPLPGSPRPMSRGGTRRDRGAARLSRCTAAVQHTELLPRSLVLNPASPFLAAGRGFPSLHPGGLSFPPVGTFPTLTPSLSLFPHPPP